MIIRGGQIFQIIISHWKSSPNYFVSLSHWIKKIITSNKLNMGFLSVPNLVPWLIFRAWIITDIVLLDKISLQLDREVIKERQDGERVGGGGGQLLKGGHYFKYFHQRGAIIWGRRLIEGRLLFKEIRYVFAGIQTRSFRKFNKWSQICDHCATWQLNIVMLKLLCLKHFSLPWMLFKVGGTEFIMNSKIHLKKIS